MYKSTNNLKKIIYTYIVGDYDSLIEPKKIAPGWDYVCFSNQANLKSRVWDIQPIPEEYFKFEDPKRISSLLKIEYYKLVHPSYDLVMTMDANIECNSDLNTALENEGVDFDSYDFYICKHPDRKCAYKEIEKVKELGFDWRDTMDKATSYLRSRRYPINNGLYETGIMIRNNKSEWVRAFHENWSKNYRLLSRRDQVSVNFSLWEAYKKKPRKYSDIKKRIKLMRDTYKDKGKNPNFSLNKHKDKTSRSKKPGITYVATNQENQNNNGELYYFIGFDKDKNLGASYNRCLNLLPNDHDWAVFFDSDTICTTSDFGKIIQDSINSYPQADAFTCYTNRVNCEWQIAPGVDHESNCMLYHRTFGELCRQQYDGQCIDVTKKPKNKVMSGMFFALKKSTWQKCGKFPEKGMLGIDNHLHWQIINKKLKLYLIQSLYVYHWYRNNNKGNVSHLKK